MSKLYVFAIGGTGARVLKSLVMLLASGVKCDSTIVPVIIDPDISNGDLSQTINLLNLYAKINSKIRYSSGDDAFFKTSIEDRTNNNWRLSIANIRDCRFKDFIGIEQMNEANQMLCEALFSTNNLESNMNVGFKGNPNIGSVVLNQFIDSDQFKNLCNDFGPGDRIFIISSIFGGTGASGFPLLLKTIREFDNIPNHDFINHSRIGAITVLPYFGLANSNESEIDSSTFMSKTKSALNYYADNISNAVPQPLDAFYYIGDEMKSSLPNCEGGIGQHNPAHLIEMVSALAVLDFERTVFTTTQPSTIHKEFGMKDIEDGMVVTFNTLSTQTNVIVKKSLIKMFLMIKYLDNHFHGEGMRQPWAVTREINSKFVQSEYYVAVEQFLNSFKEWVKDMEKNERKFSPFVTTSSADSDVFDTIRGVEHTKYRLFARAKSYWLIDDYLNGVSKDNAPIEQQFMTLFNDATSKAVDKMFNI